MRAPRLFEERDRIAADRHDVVVQRLFPAGLALQGLRRYTTEPTALDRITSVVRDLDETIHELRGTIFSLRAAPEAVLREGLSNAARHSGARQVEVHAGAR